MPASNHRRARVLESCSTPRLPPPSSCSLLCHPDRLRRYPAQPWRHPGRPEDRRAPLDRKSTRLNSSHTVISYAVFCLKKKKKKKKKKGKKYKEKILR